jgi:hypothetical protein
MALSLYGKTQGKAFTFMSCYELLGKSAKWFEYNTFLEKKNEQNKTIKSRDSSPPPSSGPVTTQATSDASGNETSVPPTRLIGRKKAKIKYQEQQLEISNHDFSMERKSASNSIQAIKMKFCTFLSSPCGCEIVLTKVE